MLFLFNYGYSGDNGTTAAKNTQKVYANNSISKWTINGDEKWIPYNIFRRRHQWLEKSARSKPEPKKELYPKKICYVSGGI